MFLQEEAREQACWFVVELALDLWFLDMTLNVSSSSNNVAFESQFLYPPTIPSPLKDCMWQYQVQDLCLLLLASLISNKLLINVLQHSYGQEKKLQYV